MISLLLTLFVSLFSICPSVNRLEDQYENNVINDSSIIEKRQFSNTYNLYCSFADFGRLNEYRSSLAEESNFIGCGSSGDYVLNNPGTYTASSTLLSSGMIGLYFGTYNNGSYQLVSKSATFNHVIFYNFDDSTYFVWRFDITVDGVRYIVDTNIYIIEGTFGGQNQVSYSYDTWVRRSNYSIDGTEDFQGQLGRYYVYMNLNVWGEFFSGLANSDFQSGYIEGYSVGYENGRVDTQTTYDDQVYEEGRQFGYAEGFQDALDTGSTASTIFSGILDVALIPVNVFLTIFNFEVFGINIAGIVSALLTISVVVIIIRFVTGKKDD